ncbi:MAG: fibronectin type III domain-containing protein [Patescibacteria group bacterium]
MEPTDPTTKQRRFTGLRSLMAQLRPGSPQTLLSNSRFQSKNLLLFIALFAVVGSVLIFRSFAAGTSTISGIAFKDLNRNGVMDVGEEPMADQILYLMGSDESFIAGVASDSAGRYTFSGIADGNYIVRYSSSSWEQIWEQWVPTTTPTIKPERALSLSGSATVDFGWRPIIWSTDLANPISSFTAADGLRVQSYNDVVTAQEIDAALRQGTLIGKEAATVTIRFAQNASSYCATTSGGSFTATCYISYRSWLQDGDMTLFHEYGHAWEGFYSHRSGDSDLAGYLAARGLTGDPRLGSSHAWSMLETIAEDYRQLFGSANAATGEQENREIPLAKDVPGLREYLSGEFMTGTSSTLSAPTNLTATPSLSPEGPTVQLNWTASTGTVSRYDIYRSTTGTTPTKIGYLNNPSTTYYDGSNLTYNTQYSYYVKAVASDGTTTSSASNTVTVTTPNPDTTKPSAPSGLMSTGTTTTSISLQWLAATDNVGVKEYRIYQDGTRKTLTSLKGTATGTNFTVTGLKSNTSHTFYVTAVDAAGNESLPSKTLSVKTKR